MKTVRIAVLLTGLGLAGAVASLQAGDGAGSGALPATSPLVRPASSSNTPPTIANSGHILPPPESGRLLYEPGGPLAPGWPALPPDVQTLVNQFQHDRAEYVAQRNTVRDQMSGGATAQRARIRAQLAGLRDQWLEEQRQLRSETREQLQELKAQLMNSRDEQLRDADTLGDGRHNKR